MIKRAKRILVCLLSLMLLTTAIGCSKKTNAPNVPFSEFVNTIFIDEVQCDTLSLHYTLADPSKFGITPKEITLGDFDVSLMEEDLISTENLLSTLKTYNYDSLGAEEQITYDTLKINLEQQLVSGKYLYYQEILGPTTGLQAQLPVLLAEYSFYTKSDIDTYIELLGCIDDYFEDIAEFERQKSAKGYFMSDEVADEIIKQCEDFIKNPEQNYLIDCFNDKVEEFPGITKDQIIVYQENNRGVVLESVIPAYQNIIDTLVSLKGSCINTKGLSGLKDGKDYYELLAQSNTGSSKSVKEMKSALEQTLNENMLTLSAIQLQNPNIFTEFDELTFPSSDPEVIIKFLKDAIKQDFPALADVNYDIKYVHKSLENHLSPAMYLVPPIDKYQDNRIYINQNPDYDMTRIFPTVAHEGYPGHLYQNVYYRLTDPAPLRGLMGNTGYAEGWATYVEAYSYTLAGFEKQFADYLASNMIALHCLYSLTDIGIHYDNWSKSDTIEFWNGFGIDKEAAEEIYLSILSEPGIYLPYCMGYIEIMELKRKSEKELGDKFILKNFHQFLLEIGPAPFSVIEKQLNTWLKSQ